MKSVSVIMPCLNVGKYISKCLESVLNQTLYDIEIIVVDAGSTDESLNIIKMYMEKDSRIKLICTKTRSYGFQVNLGIQEAKSEYIGIVETDDYIEHDMYEVLYSNIVNTDAEYIKCCADKYFEKNGWERRYEFIPCPELEANNILFLKPKETPRLFYSDNFIWNGIYRRDFISKFRLSETKGAAFQDIGMLFRMISNASKGIYIKHKGYNYRQDNVLSSSFSHNGLNYIFYEYYAIKSLLNELDEEWTYIYYRKLAAHILGCFYVMACENVFWEECRNSIEEMRGDIRNAVNNNILKKDSFEIAEEWECILKFLRNEDDLFRYCKNLFYHKSETIKNSLVIFGNHDWFIFGCGIRGKKLYELLRKFPIAIKGFCDNSENKQNKSCEGLPILSVGDALMKYPNAHFIVPNKMGRNEIVTQLYNSSVSMENIMLAYEELFDKFRYDDIFTLRMIL